MKVKVNSKGLACMALEFFVIILPSVILAALYAVITPFSSSFNSFWVFCLLFCFSIILAGFFGSWLENDLSFKSGYDTLSKSAKTFNFGLIIFFFGALWVSAVLFTPSNTEEQDKAQAMQAVKEDQDRKSDQKKAYQSKVDGLFRQLDCISFDGANAVYKDKQVLNQCHNITLLKKKLSVPFVISHKMIEVSSLKCFYEVVTTSGDIFSLDEPFQGDCMIRKGMAAHLEVNPIPGWNGDKFQPGYEIKIIPIK